METRVMAEMANDANIIDTVVRAHFDTCDYTADKIQPFINKAKGEKAYTHVAQGPAMVSKQRCTDCFRFLLKCDPAGPAE
jgi:hypothetical protein